MIEQTLVFAETLTHPTFTDVKSCDFSFPVVKRSDLFRLLDTSDVRDCYRSRRIKLASITHTNKAITVFLHNASDLLPGAVRITLWQSYTTCPSTGTLAGTVTYDAATGQLPKEVYYEACCNTRSLVRGTATGTFLVSGDTFDSMTVTVMQPCSGITVHITKPVIADGISVPTIGLKNA